MLKMLETVKTPERIELQIHCMNFLEDIEILLGIVSLDDYLDVKETLIENVSKVMELLFSNALRGMNRYLIRIVS